MSIFKKLFGKKNNPVKQPVELIEENNLEMEVSIGSEQDLKDEDYRYTHCFVFYCLNEESFNTIAKEVQNHDEAHLLSLKKTQSDVLMVDFTNVPGGTNLDDVNWGSMFDEWIEKLPNEGVGEKVKETLL